MQVLWSYEGAWFLSTPPAERLGALPVILQEKDGYAAELEGLIEQLEVLVHDKAAMEAERAQLAQQAADNAEQYQAAQVRRDRPGARGGATLPNRGGEHNLSVG